MTMENSFWFVLFAPQGKVTKIRTYLEKENIEFFYPMKYQERCLRNSVRKRLAFEPLLRNLLFVKSSKDYLDPILQEMRLALGINSNLYYRDLGTKKIITIHEKEMQNFIAVSSCKKHIIYLSNDEVNMKKGIKVRVIGGFFEGLEGSFMRLQGSNRVVITLPDLLSVATAFIPTRFILALE